MFSFSQMNFPLLLTGLLIGLAVVLAVIRADRRDLPAIVRALMRMRPPDGERDDGHDKGNDPPSLPKP